jgi:DUF1009 family protein
MPSASATHTPSGRPKIGIVAGWGRFPIVVVEALNAQGYETYCLGIKDHADPALKDICHHYQWLGLARLGEARRYYRRHGVQQITMAGKIQKTLLLRSVWSLLGHLPDWRTVCRFFTFFVTKRRDSNDDALLTAVIDEFALENIHVAPATDFAPELLVAPGQLTSRVPSSADWKDIAFGWRLAKEMGRLDVGQSVAVTNRAVLAVEAVEGTDECIRRAGQLCRGRGFTVVKVAKPQQDMRFDVPTIGTGTLKTMVEAGARILAVEARKTILLDQAAVLDFANRHKLVIVSLHADDATLAEHLSAA